MENSKEIWKNIIGYEGIYKISNYGRIKKDYVKYNSIYLGTYINGIKCIVLIKNNIQQVHIVAELVALVFVPNPENKLFINYINGYSTDIRAANLKWSNILEKAHKTKGISEEIVLEMRIKYMEGNLKAKEVAKLFEYNYGTTRSILKMKTRKNISIPKGYIRFVETKKSWEE